MRSIIFVIILTLLTYSIVFGGYALFTRPQIIPQYVQVRGVSEMELRLNPGNPPIYPASYKQLVYRPPQFSPYDDSPERRLELWETTDLSTISGTAAAVILPGVQAQQEQLIRTEGARRLSQIANPYKSEERETWPYQRAEAEAWAIDRNAATPFCDTIASARGIPREYFLSKVLENTRLFSGVSAEILGQQQALIDQIWRAPRIEEVMSIGWPP